MGPMRTSFANQMEAILKEVQPERTHVLYVDTAVSGVEVFERGDDFELKEIVGYGGTFFQPAFDWIEKEGINPLVAIYLTDLYCGDRPKAPDFPVIWAKPNYIKHPVPFDGPVVELDIQ
jgi:predicted metal-dependent peptidase